MIRFRRAMDSHNAFIILWVVSAILVLVALSFSYVAQRPEGVIDGVHEGDVRIAVSAFGNQIQTVSLGASDASTQIRRAYEPFVSESLLVEWVRNPDQAPGRGASSPWPDYIEIDSIEEKTPEEYEVQGRLVLTSLTGTAGYIPVSLTVAGLAGEFRILAYTEHRAPEAVVE